MLVKVGGTYVLSSKCAPSADAVRRRLLNCTRSLACGVLLATEKSRGNVKPLGEREHRCKKSVWSSDDRLRSVARWAYIPSRAIAASLYNPRPKVPRGRLDPWLLHITSPTPTADPPLELSKRLVGIDPVQTQASTVALGRLTTTKARETRHGFNHLPVSADSRFGFGHRARVTLAAGVPCSVHQLRLVKEDARDIKVELCLGLTHYTLRTH